MNVGAFDLLVDGSPCHRGLNRGVVQVLGDPAVRSFVAGLVGHGPLGERKHHIEDFLHVIPSKLLTPDETLNTSDRNQKKFTIFSRREGLAEIDI